MGIPGDRIKRVETYQACECTHGREPVRVCPGSPRCLFTTGTRYRSCVPGFGCGLARFGCGLARESVGGLVLRGFGLCGFAVRVSVPCVSRLPPVSFYRYR
jgi:hypothetical protein